MSDFDAATTPASAPTTHATLLAWVQDVAALTQPDKVRWSDGSAEEYDRLCQQLVDAVTFERLSEAKRPSSYLVDDPDRSAPSFQIVDEVTRERRLVTSEMVPAFAAAYDGGPRGELPLACHRS